MSHVIIIKSFWEFLWDWWSVCLSVCLHLLEKHSPQLHTEKRYGLRLTRCVDFQSERTRDAITHKKEPRVSQPTPQVFSFSSFFPSFLTLFVSLFMSASVYLLWDYTLHVRSWTPQTSPFSTQFPKGMIICFLVQSSSKNNLSINLSGKEMKQLPFGPSPFSSVFQGWHYTQCVYIIQQSLLLPSYCSWVHSSRSTFTRLLLNIPSQYFCMVVIRVWIPLCY